MSTVAIRDEQEPAELAIATGTAAVRTLADWAVELRAAAELAATLCQTSFVPVDFRGKPEETAAAILTGAQMGIGPMSALRSMHVIKGRVGMYAKAKVALLKAHGHDVWTEARADDAVTVAGRRKSSTREERITITMEQAKTAGWTSNETYRKTPQDMLWARAASRVCDLVAPDLIHGIATVEEADDLPPIQVAASVGAPVTVDQILDVEPSDPAPDQEAPAGSVDSGELATKPQVQRVGLMFKKLGISDRPTRLGVASQIVERPADRQLASANDLTGTEAHTLIDTLTRAAASDDPLQYLADLLDLQRDDLVDDADGGEG